MNFGGGAWKFNLGPNPNLGNVFYNDPSNWDLAWNQVVNAFGGQQGSNPHTWLTQQSAQARRDFGVAANNAQGNIDVGAFLEGYIPGMGALWSNATAAQKGQQPSMYRPGRLLF